MLKRWESSTNPFSGSPVGLFGATTDNVQALYGLSGTSVFSPTLINEARMGLTRTTNNEVSSHAGTNWAAQLGIPQSEARAYIDRYFTRYEGVKAFIDKTLEDTRREGAVRTLFGRVRPIPDITSRNPNARGFAERTAVNTPLQGTAADLIKLAMISLDRKLAERKLKTRMVLQVHDELLFEVPVEERREVEELVRAEMEGVVKLNVPLVADLGFGSNWRDL